MQHQQGVIVIADRSLQAGLHVSPGYTTERIHLVLAWQCSIVPSRPEDAAITGH